MDREIIFKDEINRIRDEKLKHINLYATSIGLDNNEELAKILRENPEVEDIFVHVGEGSNKFWNKFFNQIFKNQDGTFNVDPSKIVIGGEAWKTDCDIFKDIENLEIHKKDIVNIEEIKAKFPNLKNLELVGDLDKEIYTTDFGTLKELFEAAKYMKVMKFPTNLANGFREYMENKGHSDKFMISPDGVTMINLEKSDIPFTPDTELHIGIEDIDKFDIEELKNLNIKVTLVAKDASQLSIENLEKYKKMGLNLNQVALFSQKDDNYQGIPYDLPTYYAIKDKLDELVEGIDLNLPEKERFAQVYSRVCKNIIYDRPAAYPSSESEQEYSRNEKINCRNLKNGLLEGKAVCAGYAEILRNALSLVGIESEYIKGPVLDKEVPKEILKKIDKGEVVDKKYTDKYIYRDKEGKAFFAEFHAWNKVKLDGVWYNVDSTWDADRVRSGFLPNHCLKSDEEIRKKDRKADFKGPECKETATEQEIDKIFGGKHLYIGNTKLPNFKDFIAVVKETGEEFKNLGKEIKRKTKSFFEKISNNPKLLSDKEEDNDVTTNSSTSKTSWDLQNWGIDRKEFSENTQDIIKNIGETKKDKVSERKGIEDEVK